VTPPCSPRGAPVATTNPVTEPAAAYTIATPERNVVLTHGGRVRIGRDASNDLVIPDATVSRNHARVEWPRGHARPLVMDLGSANGTFLDGVRVLGPATVDERGALGIGKALLRIELQHPAIAAGDDAPLLCRLVTERGREEGGHLEDAAALSSLVETLERSARTVTLWVEHEGCRDAARLTFAAGRLVDARAGEARGPAALRQLLRRPGRSRYEVRVDVEPCEQRMVLSLREALAEAGALGPSDDETKPLRRFV
jgi:hypothetical protein